MDNKANNFEKETNKLKETVFKNITFSLFKKSPMGKFFIWVYFIIALVSIFLCWKIFNLHIIISIFSGIIIGIIIRIIVNIVVCKFFRIDKQIDLTLENYKLISKMDITNEQIQEIKEYQNNPLFKKFSMNWSAIGIFITFTAIVVSVLLFCFQYNIAENSKIELIQSLNASNCEVVREIPTTFFEGKFSLNNFFIDPYILNVNVLEKINPPVDIKVIYRMDAINTLIKQIREMNIENLNQFVRSEDIKTYFDWYRNQIIQLAVEVGRLLHCNDGSRGD